MVSDKCICSYDFHSIVLRLCGNFRFKGDPYLVGMYFPSKSSSETDFKDSVKSPG